MRRARTMRGMLLGLALTAMAQPALAQSAAPAPPGGCECPAKTVCLPEADKVTRTHVRRWAECKTICLPRCGCCSFLHHLWGGDPCDGADCGCGEKKCGKPREIAVLKKRFVKEDVCEVRCKPLVVPDGCKPGR